MIDRKCTSLGMHAIELSLQGTGACFSFGFCLGSILIHVYPVESRIYPCALRVAVFFIQRKFTECSVVFLLQQRYNVRTIRNTFLGTTAKTASTALASIFDRAQNLVSPWPNTTFPRSVSSPLQRPIHYSNLTRNIWNGARVSGPPEVKLRSPNESPLEPRPTRRGARWRECSSLFTKLVMPETSPSLLEWGESTIKFIFLSLDYFPKRHARGDNGNANNKGKDSFRVIGSLVHDFPLLGENLILNRQTVVYFLALFWGRSRICSSTGHWKTTSRRDHFWRCRSFSLTHCLFAALTNNWTLTTTTESWVLSTCPPFWVSPPKVELTPNTGPSTTWRNKRKIY